MKAAAVARFSWVALLLLAGPGVSRGASPPPSQSPLPFRAPIAEVGDRPVSIVRGDFNGDGVEDLAVGNEGSHDVSLLLGRGNGAFAPQVLLDWPIAPRTLASGDFNGDGALDLAAGGYDNFSVVFGHGDGTFEMPEVHRTGLDYLGDVPVAVADFNGDGRSDIAALLDGLRVFLGRSDGGFDSLPPMPLPPAYPTVFLAADVNRDGVVDLLVPSRDTYVIQVLLGRGNGTFDLLRDSGPPVVPFSLVVADVNSDGMPDLVTDAYPDLWVSLGHGDGTFEPPRVVPLGCSARTLVSADFDGDGASDLVAICADVYKVFLLPGDGRGGFGSPRDVGSWTEPSSATVSDFDSDGVPDLAVTDHGVGEVRLILDVGDPARSGQPDRYPAGADPRSVAAGDFNGDGIADLTVANGGSNDVSVLLGVGSGQFAPEKRFAAGMQPGAIVVADFNRDGIDDVATANQDSNDVSVLLGDGQGAFAPAVSYPAGANPAVLAVGDFNRDGVPDLAVAHAYSSFNVSILSGAGDGTFGPPDEFPVIDSATAIVTADFNRDGITDLAVSTNDFYCSCIVVLLGAGDGTFPTVTYVPGAGGEQAALAVGDFNRDGFPDLVFLNDGFGSINIVNMFLGLGDGNFEPGETYRAGPAPGRIAVGDIDLDGNPDVVVANNFGDISLLLGVGDGTLGNPMRFVAEPIPSAVAMADLDADGVVDLAVAGYRGVSILLNQTPAPDRPPLAVATADARVECTSPAGGEVALSAAASTDPDSSAGTQDDIATCEWFEAYGSAGQRLVGDGVTLNVTLPLGTHVLTLKVTDRAGLSGLATITVTVADTRPPDFALTVDPAVLWPPNHRMVEVHPAWTGRDACDPDPRVALVSVVSSEPDDAPGARDGHTTGDIAGLDPGAADEAITLRAERDGFGPGREYRLTYRSVDASGNATDATAIVTVPHDLGAGTLPVTPRPRTDRRPPVP